MLSVLFGVHAVSFAQQTFAFAGPIASIDGPGDSSNVILTVSSTAATYLLGGSGQINSGALTEVNTDTWVEDAMIRIRCSRYPGKFADLRPDNSNDWTGTYFLTPGLRQLSGKLIGNAIHPGDVLTFEFYEGFEDSTNSPEAIWTNLNFATTEFTPYDPPPATDLGTISTPGLSVNFLLLPEQVKWYKFNLYSPTNSTDFFRIDTEGSLLTINNDTMIALFNSVGALVDMDDDDGTNFLSLLSYGAGGSNGNLPAGDYYLAAMGYCNNAAFENGFVVASDSAYTGLFNLNFTTNLTGGSFRTVSGVIDLQDYVGAMGSQQVSWELAQMSNGTVIESGTTTLNESGGYSLELITLAGSGYVLTMKGNHWLRSAAENLNLNSNLTNVNFSEMNGDVDNDNEVGPGDFGALSSAFGSVQGDGNWNEMADLDGDQEVGPSDFGILSSRFGETGY